MTERTLLRQTRVEFEDDDISLTSSQSEQYSSDQEVNEPLTRSELLLTQILQFLVERILAERKGPDGKKYFLVFWANYPEEKSTWEPKKNIQDPEIFKIWKERKDQEARGLKPSFNVAKFDAHQQELLQAKADRLRRRKAKQKRLNLSVSPRPDIRRRADDSDSTEAVESDGVPEDDPGMKRKGKAPQKAKKPSKPAFVPPEALDEEDPLPKKLSSEQRDVYESDGAGTSDDSLIGDLQRKDEKKRAKKKASQVTREKRARQRPSKVAAGSGKSVSKKAPKVCYVICV